MALHFASGTTTYGAADHQVDFCAILEDFLVNTVGWTCVAGAGTTNMRFSSAGESGLLTMLFVHIWAAGTAIFGEVSDDAIPTHETSEGGAVIIYTERQARYWFTADLDTIIFVVPYWGYDRAVYIGLVDPVGTPTDETYRMVASDDDLHRASILRNFDNVWNVDITNYYHDAYDNIHSSRLDREFSPVALYANTQLNCAGQYRYIGTSGAGCGVEPHDRITTTFAGATSEWTVFSGTGPWWFILLTGGVPPGDQADGAGFQYATGVAGTTGVLMAAYAAFMAAVGWTFQGAPGIWTTDWLHSSPGEDGVSNIIIHFGSEATGAVDWFRVRCVDDLIMTHVSAYSTFQADDPLHYPVTYHIAGDLDCMLITIESGVAGEYFLWAGKVAPALPGITESVYLVGNGGNNALSQSGLLRGEDGTWTAISGLFDGSTMAHPSSPNAFDGTTYVLWPWFISSLIGGAGGKRNVPGVMKYLFDVRDGGVLATNDTITVGAQVYHVFSGVNTWAMRSV